MNSAVTVTFVPEQIVTWLVIGLIAGFAASVVVRGRGRGALSSIIIGLVGALIGGFLFSILRIDVSPALQGGFTLKYIDIIVAFIGAMIVLILFGGFWRRRVLP
ncbi:MAG: GlsB/YeaQ/YmgE family stress response membrane protein [Anaerolineae bacterium]|nr:GlsB/YeaQ/YmgE family stress response membrane protein [Anaerolineae bacterium]